MRFKELRYSLAVGVLVAISAAAVPRGGGPAPGSSDTFPSVTALAAVAAFLLANITALLGLGILTRSLRERREARDTRFRSRWEPVLHGRIAGDAVPLPPLARRERVLFLSLWLHMLRYVRGEGADALLKAARELDMPRVALRLLESRLPWERLLAMRAAAALRLREAVGPLLRKVAQQRRRSSLEAATALLQIDPQSGFAALRNLLAHVEWSPGAMAGIVKSGGAQGTRFLAEELAALPRGAGKHVVRLVELLEDHAALPALRERLLARGGEEEMAAILHALGRLGGREDRLAIMAHLAHPHWLVRMQAAAALGSIGLPEDGEKLLPLLRDPQWWVRYRAAQALLRLCGGERLRRARAVEPDRYALEILDRVLAES